MKSRAYRGTAVNRVRADQVGLGRDGQALLVGVDVDKYRLSAVALWPDGAGSFPPRHKPF
jgi:hypothetical protein